MNETDQLIISSCALATVCCEIINNDSNKAKETKMWMHPWRHSREDKGAAYALIPELLRFNDYFHYNNFMRMNELQFNFLLQLVSPFIQKQNTKFRKCIPPKERLIIAIRYLATGKKITFLIIFSYLK